MWEYDWICNNMLQLMWSTICSTWCSFHWSAHQSTATRPLSHWSLISSSTSLTWHCCHWHTGFSLSRNGRGKQSIQSCCPQSNFDCLWERNVEGALVAPSTQPTQGGLECLYLYELCSTICGWSVCKPLQVRDSSGFANWGWGWWQRTWLRTLNGLTHKPVSLATLVSELYCDN
jgi:hypothetical protein